MNNTFYRISEDSELRGAPWMSSGFRSHCAPTCPVCRASTGFPDGSITLRPTTEKGTFWPEVIGSGDCQGPYFSLAVKQGFDEMGFRYARAIPATVEKPYPKKMRGEPPPYFYFTGELGAEFDFEASGHRIKSVCSTCGAIKKDPTARPTHDQLKPGTWNGAEFFYTRLSRQVKFCTRPVLELAAQRKWRGFRFVPLEKTRDFEFPGLDYLNGEF